jgi:PBP1b-binding outer membrane lipoprotein LpoB
MKIRVNPVLTLVASLAMLAAGCSTQTAQGSSTKAVRDRTTTGEGSTTTTSLSGPSSTLPTPLLRRLRRPDSHCWSNPKPG